MTQNPFDALGGGGFDMNALLQQAQQMQQQLEEAQANLAQQTVEGTVAGGAVTVTANGVGELVGVAIRSGEFDGTRPRRPLRPLRPHRRGLPRRARQVRGAGRRLARPADRGPRRRRRHARSPRRSAEGPRCTKASSRT